MIRVAVADTERLRLQVLSHTITESREITITHGFTDANDLPRTCRLEDTDLLVLDAQLVDERRDQILSEIRQWNPSLKILIVLDAASESDVLAYIEAGANAFVVKSDPVARLISTIRRLAVSQTQITPADGKSMVYNWTREEYLQSGLTPRERNVLSGLANGRSNREISEAYGLSEKTVKNHVSTILSKLGVHTRTQAAVLAVARGLVAQADNQGPRLV